MIGTLFRKSGNNNLVYGINEGGLGRTSYNASSLLIGDGTNTINQIFLKDNQTPTPIQNSYNTVTSGTIYNGVPYFNGSQSYNSNNNYYLFENVPKEDYWVAYNKNGTNVSFLSPLDSSHGDTVTVTANSGWNIMNSNCYNMFWATVYSFTCYNSSSSFSNQSVMIGNISKHPVGQTTTSLAQDDGTGYRYWYSIETNGDIILHIVESVPANTYFFLAGGFRG